MMPIYLVDLSLREPGHDYSVLWAAFKQAHAQPLMDTTWLIDVNQSVEDVTRALLAHLTPADRLFVLQFTPTSAWTGTGLDEEAKGWLREKLPGVKAGMSGDRAPPADRSEPAV